MARNSRLRPIADDDIDGDLIMAGSPFLAPARATEARDSGLGDALAAGEILRFMFALVMLLTVIGGFAMASR